MGLIFSAVGGAALGAALVILLGHVLKGREFLGLAVTFFILGLVVSVGFAAVIVLETTYLAYQAGFPPYIGENSTLVVGMASYIAAFVPGAFFVLLASPAKRDN